MALAGIANALHLQQVHTVGIAPSGIHKQYEDTYRFPHIDENDNCWTPEFYDPDMDFAENREWIDYEDTTSEIMRAECRW